MTNFWFVVFYRESKSTFTKYDKKYDLVHLAYDDVDVADDVSKISLFHTYKWLKISSSSAARNEACQNRRADSDDANERCADDVDSDVTERHSNFDEQS